MRNGNSNDRNRHGIPLYGGERYKPVTCIWPACPDLVKSFRRTRMCDDHALYVVEGVERVRRPIVADLTERIEQAKAERARVAADGDVEQREEVIYYVRDGEHIKIGWTTDLRRRLKRGFKPGGKLLASHPGTRADEARLHRQFAAYRTHGNEWYAPMPSLLHHIEMVKQKHGEPEDIEVGPAPVTIPQPREKQYVAGKRFIKPGGVLYGKYR